MEEKFGKKERFFAIFWFAHAHAHCCWVIYLDDQFIFHAILQPFTKWLFFRPLSLSQQKSTARHACVWSCIPTHGRNPHHLGWPKPGISKKFIVDNHTVQEFPPPASSQSTLLSQFNIQCLCSNRQVDITSSTCKRRAAALTPQQHSHPHWHPFPGIPKHVHASNAMTSNPSTWKSPTMISSPSTYPMTALKSSVLVGLLFLVIIRVGAQDIIKRMNCDLSSSPYSWDFRFKSFSTRIMFVSWFWDLCGKMHLTKSMIWKRNSEIVIRFVYFDFRSLYYNSMCFTFYQQRRFDSCKMILRWRGTLMAILSNVAFDKPYFHPQGERERKKNFPIEDHTHLNVL